MTDRTPDDRAQLKIRCRESLRAKLEASAKAADRSLNAEIVARLAENSAVEGKPRRGRPCMAPAERRRHIRTFRVRDELLERMTAEAARFQMSVSELAERAVEQFFLSEDLMRVVRETIRQEMRAEFQAREGSALNASPPPAYAS